MRIDITDLLSDAGKATRLAVLVHGLGDPINPGVTADLQIWPHSLANMSLAKWRQYVLPCG